MMGKRSITNDQSPLPLHTFFCKGVRNLANQWVLVKGLRG